ncbi:NAD(P)/FAD-dependent oxidoreductase [Saccharicrinis sp. GN24d3]|uniref:NAD(P)/FAD-dependent oxidoreductase n=1 Tax=Saccharicrinis sp. GN24d3 TaxID=3458416 RepID=UPI0040362E29
MKDYLIVGQGLAGMLIANQLMQRNKSFLAVADKNQISATSVAAGMYNPLVFRRITKSWMVDDLLPEMYSTFSELEERLHTKLIYPTPIVKLVTEDEYRRWTSKLEDPEIEKYIQKLEKGTSIHGIHQFYGSATISDSGFIDLQALQENFHQELLHYNHLVYDHFYYDDINIQEDCIIWKGSQFKNIIFCEGAFAIDNPLFPEVTYKLTKGDVINLSIDEIQLENIINKMVFLMEKSKGEFLSGSTYNWSGLNFTAFEEDRNYLSEKLSSILNKPFKILRHKTAIRPTVSDRRPVLGTHRKYNNVHYFNGLGTKGVMLAPYFSNQMIEYLEEKKVLHPEVTMNRFR